MTKCNEEMLFVMTCNEGTKRNRGGVAPCVGAEEVLLSPEVVELVGDACALQHCAGGHALLLGMTGEADTAPKAPAAGSRSQAGRELTVLPAGLQQLAVQVHTRFASISPRSRAHVLKKAAVFFRVLLRKLVPALGGWGERNRERTGVLCRLLMLPRSGRSDLTAPQPRLGEAAAPRACTGSQAVSHVLDRAVSTAEGVTGASSPPWSR